MVTTLSPPGPIRTPLWLSGGLPVLAGQDKPNDGLFFPRNTIPKGIFYGALRFADPLKIGAYSLAFLLAWNVLYVEPRRAAAQETYRRARCWRGSGRARRNSPTGRSSGSRHSASRSTPTSCRIDARQKRMITMAKARAEIEAKAAEVRTQRRAVAKAREKEPLELKRAAQKRGVSVFGPAVSSTGTVDFGRVSDKGTM